MRGLVAEGHGEVGVVPAAEDADALELGALEVDVLLRVLAAGAADGDGVHLEFFAAELLVDLDLDGEAVAVPAGDVGGVEAGHGLGFDDEVLDALVEGVAEVDGSVGVGRAVVEDVFGGSGAGGADLGVEILFLPGRRGGWARSAADWPSWGRWSGAGSRSTSAAWVCGRGVLFPDGEVRVDFSGLGVRLGCVRHSFLVFLIAEVRFAPNSYCRRGSGGYKPG